MTDYGYSWCEIVSELWARGIDPDSVSLESMYRAIHQPTPEGCARQIAREYEWEE